MTFYKAIREDELKSNLIPGTVTNDIDEAITWFDRYNSRKRNGITRHIKQGKAVIIKFDYDEKTLESAFAFQMAGVHEHERLNCWTSVMKQKAQINTPIQSWTIIER